MEVKNIKDFFMLNFFNFYTRISFLIEKNLMKYFINSEFVKSKKKRNIFTELFFIL